MSVFHTEDKEWNSSNSSRFKNYPICSNYHLFKSNTSMRCRFNCQIYYTIYIIFTEFFKLNVWYYNVTHLYEVDYRLLCHISSFLYEIFMELFLSRQNDQIAPVLDTCGWRCSVTPLSLSTGVEYGKAVLYFRNILNMIGCLFKLWMLLSLSSKYFSSCISVDALVVELFFSNSKYFITIR